jgi:hypothetical protein
MNYRPVIHLNVDGCDIDEANIPETCRLIVSVENAERKLVRFVNRVALYSHGLDPFER